MKTSEIDKEEEYIYSITAYKTSDGEIFEDEVDARAHQLLINAKKWYSKNPLCDNDGHENDFDDVCNWIIRNKSQIKKYLKI